MPRPGKVIDARGGVSDGTIVDIAFIGCGSHSFRNIYPCFHFLPVELKAVCDLNQERADAFGEKFGAESFTDYKKMIAETKVDVVFIVTGYDSAGRPLDPEIAKACLDAGCHVWMEKPPAATSAELEVLKSFAASKGKTVLTGFKKMFFPCNEKAAELIQRDDFGDVSIAHFEYPLYIPSVDEFETYGSGTKVQKVLAFLDHICHPASIMVYLLGYPTQLIYHRNEFGAGTAHFKFQNDTTAEIHCNTGACFDGGMEETKIFSKRGTQISIKNNNRITYHRNIGHEYGNEQNYYTASPEETSATWEPEFSLGQLYNKGLFMLGYMNETNEIIQAAIEDREVKKGTLDQAIILTRIFEAFAQGPDKLIDI